MGLMDYMKQITPEMTQKVSELRKSNFKDATPDDIELYAQYTALVKMQEDEFSQRRKQLEEVQAAKMEAVKENAKTSKEALEALRDAALAKLEAVKNGQA